jgi:hypothetical protein
MEPGFLPDNDSVLQGLSVCNVFLWEYGQVFGSCAENVVPPQYVSTFQRTEISRLKILGIVMTSISLSHLHAVPVIKVSIHFRESLYVCSCDQLAMSVVCVCVVLTDAEFSTVTNKWL